MNSMLKLNTLNKLPTVQPLRMALVKNYSDVVDRPDNPDIKIPMYERRLETIETTKARLIYQSRKRGMLENDLLLSTFVSKYLKEMTDEQVKQYDILINNPSNDWDIYYWATGKKPIPKEYNNEIMKLFCDHVKNVHMEDRTRMPDL